MSTDQHDIIQCASCGQRMRVPAGAHNKVYKCVKCGGLVSTGRGTPPPMNMDSTLVKPGGQSTTKTMADLFIEMGMVTREQAEEALQQQHPHEKFFEVLLRLEMISREELHTRLSKEQGAAAINLAHFSIDRDVTELVPLEVVQKHWVLPISSLGKSLTVAMVCPVDMDALVAVEEITGMRILSMLCKMDDFLAAVRKHYRIPDSSDTEAAPPTSAPPQQEGAAPAPAPPPPPPSIIYPGDEVIRKALDGLARLPIPARVLNQVDAVVGVESEGLRQLVSVVGNSPSLAFNLLSTANSAAYGLPHNVDSIPMAITLIGEQAVSLLAANAPKMPVTDEKLWVSLTHFSRHCAEIAAVLALDCGRVTPNVAYCAGLLHAVGSYALGALEPEEYAKIDPNCFGEKRIHAEKQVFGIGYPEAGALVCEEWGMPDVLHAALCYSVKPDEAGDFRDIATIVHIATNLAGIEGEINRDGLEKSADALRSLNIDPSEIANSLGKSTVGATSANQ